MNRVYSIDFDHETLVILVRRDGSCARRLYRGEFGGHAWREITRTKAAFDLKLARQHAEDGDTSIARQFV